MHNIRYDAIRWQRHDFLFDGKSNVCFIFHDLRDIRNTRKIPNSDLENEDQGQRVEERDLRHFTGNVWIHMGDFFQIFSCIIATYVYAKDNTHAYAVKHTHTHSHKDRGDNYTQNLPSRFS